MKTLLTMLAMCITLTMAAQTATQDTCTKYQDIINSTMKCNWKQCDNGVLVFPPYQSDPVFLSNEFIDKVHVSIWYNNPDLWWFIGLFIGWLLFDFSELKIWEHKPMRMDFNSHKSAK